MDNVSMGDIDDIEKEILDELFSIVVFVQTLPCHLLNLSS